MMIASFLGGGLFEAMWNNFYNATVRDVSTFTRGSIITVMVVLGTIALIEGFKGGDEKKPIKNWFAFWMAIIIIVLGVVYTILCNL